MEGVSIKNLERPPGGEKQGEQSLRDLVEDFVWTTCECCVVTSSDCTSLILSSHLRPTCGLAQVTYRKKVLGSKGSSRRVTPSTGHPLEDSTSQTVIPGDRGQSYCPEASGETEVKAVTSANRTVSLQPLPLISGFRGERTAGVVRGEGRRGGGGREEPELSLVRSPGERPWGKPEDRGDQLYQKFVYAELMQWFLSQRIKCFPPKFFLEK